MSKQNELFSHAFTVLWMSSVCGLVVLLNIQSKIKQKPVLSLLIKILSNIYFFHYLLRNNNEKYLKAPYSICVSMATLIVITIMFSSRKNIVFCAKDELDRILLTQVITWHTNKQKANKQTHTHTHTHTHTKEQSQVSDLSKPLFGCPSKRRFLRETYSPFASAFVLAI